jgi:hypothetical protein
MLSLSKHHKTNVTITQKQLKLVKEKDFRSHRAKAYKIKIIAFMPIEMTSEVVSHFNPK